MKYRLIDTHCHPQMRQFDADRDEVIERALTQSVGIVCVGTDLETSRRAIELSERYDGLYASVGLHPNDNLGEIFVADEYDVLARHPKVVSIGEIGLDYYRTTEPGLQLKQRERFERQLELVKRTGKPAIIHCRDAHDEMLRILSRKENVGTIRGVIHSFTGTADQACEYVRLGFSIGLNGIITFARDYDESVISIPTNRILLETDAPYLAPVPYRGKRNEPSYITEVAKKLSELRGESLLKIENVTTNNALVMFGIDG